MKRRGSAIAALAAAALVAVHGAVWWLVCGQIAGQMAAWQADMAAQGVRVTSGVPGYGGWPLAATRIYPDFALAAGPLALRTGRLSISVSPLHPGTVWIGFPDPVSLTAPGLVPVTLAAPEGRLAAPLRGQPALAFDAPAMRLEAAQPGGPPRVLTSGLLHAGVDFGAQATVLGFSAEAITLPEPRPDEVLPLGPRLASLSFDATLRGRVGAARPPAEALAAWRDAGGGLEISRFAMGYGALGLSGQGRFGLDGGLQPSGQASLHILGYQPTLDALAAAHVMTAHAAQTVGAILALLAQTPAGGGAPQVQTTLVVRDGTLSIAGFPLLRLPPLAWQTGS